MGGGSVMISNKVYTGHLWTEVDLFSDSLLEINGYKAPRGQFPGARLKLAGSTCLIFKSGDVIINAVKDEQDELEFELVIGFRIYDIKMVNCSGYMKVGKLGLNKLKMKINTGLYEPELHPGLMVKIGKVSAIFYHTGTIMFCGCRSEKHMHEVKDTILDMINM